MCLDTYANYLTPHRVHIPKIKRYIVCVVGESCMTLYRIQHENFIYKSFFKGGGVGDEYDAWTEDVCDQELFHLKCLNP